MTDHLTKNVRSRPAVHARKMARDLRLLAEEIERFVETYEKNITEPDAASQLMGRVVHATSWGWANLNFDLLNQSAIDVNAVLRAQSEISEEWEYSISGHENVTFSSKDAAVIYNDRFVSIDIDPGTILRRRPGSKPSEWEVAP